MVDKPRARRRTSHARKEMKRLTEQAKTPSALDTGLAVAIRQFGTLLEGDWRPKELRRAARVLRALAYIATLRANASVVADEGAWPAVALATLRARLRAGGVA